MSGVAAGGLTRRGLRAAGNRVLIQATGGPALTGDEILADVDGLASALIERGYAGRTIGLWYRNSVAAIEAFLAVEWIGGARLAVDPNAAPAEVEAVFAAGGAAAVLTDKIGAPHLSGDVLIHDRDQPLRGASTCPEIVVEGGRTLILYPRAVQADGLFSVPISYANWDATLETSIALFRSGAYGAWREQDAHFLSCQQIMHGTGFLGTFPFLAMGLPQVIIREFEVNAVIDAIEALSITST
ncbi:MAG: AMP-binding protein, partial [Hyphomicrobiales bacterium]|nr:AMP-binding protein [Hyphomicrobiales bacterium]